ncbi:MAG: biotin transport system substrate-specific component [Tepidanaerobacteraceae bacterium]|nr:biotin transport system substrate-specific component [Tepidanaerobacteraceae bacterium]
MGNQNQPFIQTREIPFIGLFAALTAVLSYIEIPLPVVPITAQTLGVMLAGSLLSPIPAFLSMVLFLLLGVIGLPVYAGGASGIGTIFGPTGGFLLSWPVAVFVMAHLMKRFKPSFRNVFIINIVGGILVVYGIGVPYLARIAHLNFTSALTVGALPFIPGDLAKAFISTTVSLAIRKANKNFFDDYNRCGKSYE